MRIAGGEGAALIVAGAYGQGRLSECVFGGATRNRAPAGALIIS